MTFRGYVYRRWHRLNARFRRTFRALRAARQAKDRKAVDFYVEQLTREPFWPDRVVREGRAFGSLWAAVRHVWRVVERPADLGSVKIGKRGDYVLTPYAVYYDPDEEPEPSLPWYPARRTPRPVRFERVLRPALAVVWRDVLLVVDRDAWTWCAFDTARVAGFPWRRVTHASVLRYRYLDREDQTVNVLRLWEGPRWRASLADCLLSGLTVVELPPLEATAEDPTAPPSVWRVASWLRKT